MSLEFELSAPATAEEGVGEKVAVGEEREDVVAAVAGSGVEDVDGPVAKRSGAAAAVGDKVEVGVEDAGLVGDVGREVGVELGMFGAELGAVFGEMGEAARGVWRLPEVLLEEDAGVEPELGDGAAEVGVVPEEVTGWVGAF